MSFEGYYQRLCKNGHDMDADVYNAESSDLCQKCGAPVAWEHLVDQTNDSGDPVSLEIEKQTKCDHCGTVLEITYRMPRMD